MYTVSTLNYTLRNIIGDAFPDEVEVRGETTNVSKHNTMTFFSIKDEYAELQCITRGNQVEQGKEVVVTGQPQIYHAKGTLQLLVTDLEVAAQGKAYKAFLETKKRLTDEGFFTTHRKQDLPRTPRHITVLTSTTGSVQHDILRITKRWPFMEVSIKHIPVQGENAANQIVCTLQAIEETDVICIARGGGSYEDLYCFNDEKLARTIANHDLPIVTSIGHEDDTTIADLVADKRCSTPTDAANTLTPEPTHVKQLIASAKDRVRWAYTSRLRSTLENVKQHRRQSQTLYRSKLTTNLQRLYEIKTKLEKADPLEPIRNGFVKLIPAKPLGHHKATERSTLSDGKTTKRIQFID